MSSHLKEQDDESIRDSIIMAAQCRFHSYGPTKTTMVEIAGDINMSASNLYRYFKNKNELAEECAWQLLHAQLKHLKDIILQDSVTATSRLQEFMMTICQQTYELSEKEPRFHNLIEYVNTHDSKLMLRKMKIEIDLINELLVQGKNNGEFIVDNTDLTACIIHAAIMFYEAPETLKLYSTEQIAEMIQQSNNIMLHGLLPR